MADRDLVEQKVKAYLEGLSPQARKMLVGGMESSRKKGDGDQRLDTILSVAQTMGRKRASNEKRHDRIMRAFFRPVTPFLYDGSLPKKQRGRIARTSVGRIWTWIVRDVAPQPLVALLEKEQSQEGLDEETIDQVTAQVRAETLRVIRSHLADMRQAPRGTHRLAIQLGGTAQIHDLEDILDILQHENEFDEFFTKLPKKITASELVTGSYSLKLADAFMTTFRNEAVFAASGMLGRLENARLLAHLAIRLARTEHAKTISATPFAAFIDILLSEIERRVDLFAQSQEIGVDIKELAAEIDGYHTLVRVLDVEVDLNGAVEWTSRLSESRRRMSELVAREIEPAASAIRQCLRYTGKPFDKLTFDPHLHDDACRALNALVAARRATDSLAVNELQSRTWRDVQNAVDIMAYGLLERYRDCERSARGALAKKLGAAIEFARIAFGDDYAAVLQRSRDNADLAPEKRATGT